MIRCIPLGGRDRRDLPELVVRQDIPDCRVALEVLAEGDPAERRLERKVVDDELVELVILHRQRLDGEEMDADQVGELLRLLGREPDEILSQSRAESIPHREKFFVIVERLARGGRAKVVDVEDAFDEERPVRNEVLRLLAEKHLLEVDAVPAAAREARRFLQDERDPGDVSRLRPERYGIEEPGAECLLSVGQHPLPPGLR